MVIASVFPRKRQAEPSFWLDLRTGSIGGHYCGIPSEKYQNILVLKCFLKLIPFEYRNKRFWVFYRSSELVPPALSRLWFLGMAPSGS